MPTCSLLRCPKPDIIIMNSGLHDDKKDPHYFVEHLQYLFEEWKKKFHDLDEGPVKLVWKSLLEGSGDDDLYPPGMLKEWNELTYDVTKHFNVPFVNISNAFKYVPRYAKDEELYTPDNLHFGAIGRSEPEDKHLVGSVSTVITQMLLHEICSGRDQFFGNFAG